MRHCLIQDAGEEETPTPARHAHQGAVFVVLCIALACAAPVAARATRSAPTRHAPRCQPLLAPTSASAQASYRRRLALKRSVLRKARARLTREGRTLSQAAPHRLGSRDSARLRSRVLRLHERVKCLAAELANAPVVSRPSQGDAADDSGLAAGAGTGGFEPTPAESIVAGGGSAQSEAPVVAQRVQAAPETEPSPEPPAPEVPSTGGALSIAVQGNHLVNENGQTVTLHGVDISGTQWQCLAGAAFASPSDDAAIAAIAAWHVNAVRIPLNEDCWLGINGVPKDVGLFRAEIAEYVERLHAHGLYAILDLHWNAPGETLSHMGAGFSGNFGMADADHSPAFWASVASYFKSDHAVLFDLYNEPTEISWGCWLGGCTSPRGFATAGMQQLLDAVRSTGATQPVMVNGLERASLDGPEWLGHHPIDPAGQLVASAHIYGQKKVARFESNLGVVAARFPVVLGEVGEKDCRDVDLDALLPWADQHGVSYLAWDWFTGECSDPSLISDYSGTPTPFGIGYREHLLATFPAP
jgi:endoglucanase